MLANAKDGMWVCVRGKKKKKKKAKMEWKRLKTDNLRLADGYNDDNPKVSKF